MELIENVSLLDLGISFQLYSKVIQNIQYPYLKLSLKKIDFGGIYSTLSWKQAWSKSAQWDVDKNIVLKMSRLWTLSITWDRTLQWSKSLCY